MLLVFTLLQTDIFYINLLMTVLLINCCNWFRFVATHSRQPDYSSLIKIERINLRNISFDSNTRITKLLFNSKTFVIFRSSLDAEHNQGLLIKDTSFAEGD